MQLPTDSTGRQCTWLPCTANFLNFVLLLGKNVTFKLNASNESLTDTCLTCGVKKAFITLSRPDEWGGILVLQKSFSKMCDILRID